MEALAFLFPRSEAPFVAMSIWLVGWSCHWWRCHVARLWDYILGEVWLMVKGGDDEESALKDVERDDEENEKEDNY